MQHAAHRAANAVCITILFGMLSGYAYGQASPSRVVRFIGFSTRLPPGDSLVCRQALAHSIDRETVAKAVAPHLQQTPYAATRLQHPGLPGYDATGPQGCAYDPASARELYTRCGFSEPLAILVRGGDRFRQVEVQAVAESLKKALGTQVTWNEIADLNVVVRAAKEGTVPIWLLGVAFGPERIAAEVPMYIGWELTNDSEVRALLQKSDARGVEELILQKALIIPIIYY